MPEFIRRNLRFFILVAAAGFILRLFFVFHFPGVVTDSFVYGDIAKNWLQHGIYGLSGTDEISPTYIRLPGYPAFLALIFAIFGMEHYRAVLITQTLIDLGTCLICADIARRLLGDRCAKAAFALAAFCPFLADYSAAALTETCEIFFTALALDFAISALHRRNLSLWIGCGLSCAAAITLRPDGGLLLIAILLYIGWLTVGHRESGGSRLERSYAAKAAMVVFAFAVLPLVPWTVRNWRVFHQFQPLAPRYANEEGEFVPMGFNRWSKTWIADYTSVEEVYWSVPGNPIDPAKLPKRAFDSPRQEGETERVISDYNNLLHVSPSLDARFEAIALDRIHTHPFRYYLQLPMARIADMWLRPRTEMLPCDSRWWEFNDEPKWSALAVMMGVVGLFYVLSAIAGVFRKRALNAFGLLVLFVVLRSAFLGTLENPEPRYTLEMYPIVIVFAAAGLVRNRQALTSAESA